jgi:hypothetical protein
MSSPQNDLQRGPIFLPRWNMTTSNGRNVPEFSTAHYLTKHTKAWCVAWMAQTHSLFALADRDGQVDTSIGLPIGWT